MKNKEIKSKSSEELELKLPELKKELIKLNAQVATGTTLKSPGQIKKIKKNIAKILTKLNKTKPNKNE
ncbi:50S ribosomal protein L29 [Candidatus Woesearchaeota archaeon]|nr:50S ribosomal protein L29 [Candidatus Woesearchaeota archaeon]